MDGGKVLARRYHVARRGVDGDLIVLRQQGWLSYDATETIIGPRGEKAGDVNAARLGSTVKFDGTQARVLSPGNCEVILTLNRDGSWSMSTKHCFDGAAATLDERFIPVS